VQVANFNEMLHSAGKGALQKMDVQQSELEEMEDEYTSALEHLRDHLEVGIYSFVVFRIQSNPYLSFLWVAMNLNKFSIEIIYFGSLKLNRLKETLNLSEIKW
jgi:hypothetical protein